MEIECNKKWHTFSVMKRQLLLGILCVIIGIFFAGCNTVNMLSRIQTGNVGANDVWESLMEDDQEFQKNYW